MSADARMVLNHSSKQDTFRLINQLNDESISLSQYL